MTEEQEKYYYIVNPRGAIHIVDYDHAFNRLQQPGWRLATKAEIQKYLDAGGNQRFDQPLAEPWNPMPQTQELPEEAAIVAPRKKRAAPDK